MLCICYIPSCCICHLFHSEFSIYVHLMYIFLSLFSVDGFYCAILLDIVLFCCCTPDNDVDSPSLDMGRHKESAPPSVPQARFTAASLFPIYHEGDEEGVLLQSLRGVLALRRDLESW